MIASVVRGHLHYADWGRHAWETHLSNLLLLGVLGTRNPWNAVRTPQKEFLLHILVQSHVQGVVLCDDIFDCLRDPAFTTTTCKIGMSSFATHAPEISITVINENIMHTLEHAFGAARGMLPEGCRHQHHECGFNYRNNLHLV